MSVQVQPFESVIEPSFWHELNSYKVESLKLDTSAVPLFGRYSSSSHSRIPQPSRLHINSQSFPSDEPPSSSLPTRHFLSCGLLYNHNTIESYKQVLKQVVSQKDTIMPEAARLLWSDTVSGAVIKEPHRLCRFHVLSFADLKKHRYHYWIAFPALAPPGFRAVEHTPVVPLAEYVSHDGVATLDNSLNAFMDEHQSSHNGCPAFFIAQSSPSGIRVYTLDKFETLREEDGELLFAFMDPCSLIGNAGWPLRNYVLFLAVKWKLSRVRILCVRGAGQGLSGSMVMHLSLEGAPGHEWDVSKARVLGWERHPQGRMKPRVVDLKSMLDEKLLASSSVDLNLKLMRWRLLPSIDLDTLAGTKCLLIGAGTLGCSVSRSLLAWGVRKITFVDNGRVSFSNPVRQSLFEFEDCRDGGAVKATCAAEHLRRIFPCVDSSGHRMSVPMPGHPVNKGKEEEEVLGAVDTLSKLVQEHDVVFLLTDTRESRWFPSLLCAVFDKMCINAALGFDSYVVLRHGGAPGDEHSRVGCYFCNDVVAPTDSLSDRTLDQQCTVTRPGTGATASALAVELMVALLHHPLRHRAPAHTEKRSSECDLGLLPHQIRGSLKNWNTMLLSGTPFDRCPACSAAVVEEFRTRGRQMVLDALNDPMYLERLTGLHELKQDLDADACDWDNEDDDW